jgi:hypothetical protein
LFDVALNGHTVARDVDIWKEAGYSGALKKVFYVHVTGGKLTIAFPKVEAGQALISAIAVAGKGRGGIPPGTDRVEDRRVGVDTLESGLETAYDQKPMVSYKAAAARVAGDTVEWDVETGVADKYSLTLKYRWLGGAPVTGRLEMYLANGTLIREESETFTTTPEGKWNYLSTSTGTMVNAGHYKLRVILPRGVKLDELQVQ